MNVYIDGADVYIGANVSKTDIDTMTFMGPCGTDFRCASGCGSYCNCDCNCDQD